MMVNIIIDAPIWQGGPVTKRLDGTFEIVAENGPYQVCPSEIDPAGVYDFEAVSSFWSTLAAADPRKLTESDLAPITMEQARAAKLSAIHVERDRRIAAGVSFSGALYDSDDKAQIRVTGALMQLSLAASAGQTPPPVNWVAMDDSVHALDMAGLIGLGQAISGRLSACVLAANTHKIALDGLSDAEAVLAYDIGAGWPL